MPENMNTLIDKAIRFFDSFNKNAAAPAQQAPAEDNTAAAVAAERKRINDLDAYDAKDNAIVAAMIAQAKQNGQTIDDIKPYIDTVEKNSDNAPAKNLVKDMIEDNKDSGVNGIGSNPKADEEEAAANDAKMMDSFVKAMDNYGGKK